MSLAVILTSVAGLLLGLLGTGGSLLIVPILVYAAGLSPHQSVSLSLLIVGSATLLGLVLNLRRGAVNLPIGGVFGIAGIIGSSFGGRVTHLVPPHVLMLCFSALMIVIGAKMLMPQSKPVEPRSVNLAACLAVGGAVGLLTGFFGVGGGFLVVPGLVLFGGLEMKTAVATSLGIIALNCLAGLAGQVNYLPFNLSLALTFVLAASAGMVAGIALTNYVTSDWLRRVFGGGLVLLGGFLLTRQAGM